MPTWTRHIISRQALKRLVWLAVVLLALAVIGWRIMFHAPGSSYAGVVDAQPGPLSDELRSHVMAIAGEIGPRGTFNPEAYNRAADYITDQFIAYGYQPTRNSYLVGDVECHNIIAEIAGTKSPERILVIGAHYDTVEHTPGANDNTSGVAATLALARRFADTSPAITLRFVAFANEEPPHFQTERMGSMVYARLCKERGERIVGMMSLETIGYYSDEPGSQRYPSPFDQFYPDTGNFIGFVSNVPSRLFMHEVVESFRKHGNFPSESGAVPGLVPGVGWSDHWAFWEVGYPALMVTDTAPFRYPHYHRSTDTPDKLDYDRMAIVVEGLRAVISELVAAP